ncbi:uncharacterized protein B0H18DRAFT_937624 [Fomitopsis serialis]|uniref:uncharacterized protein n=1 Tax=Fomitopsis serialis TaxID=139415 RepID=UPI0020080538|nr:uncharacterized protein B0H18DRAFT_937624 [Neoantrodia serialis]KAH9918855.1 hypothetical protein B0H18DRAFT_937624 [Neoantrodia serialis]
MPARTTAPADIETIAGFIPKVFEQVQYTVANHQKNHIALYKLHLDAATHTQSVQNGKSIKLIGERAFEYNLIGMLYVLPVKKGISVADRVIKFVGGYTKFINEKTTEAAEEKGEEEETTASRFVSRVLRFLLSGCAKDKTVRYRVVQCIAEMIAHLDEIDEDLYSSLRSSLMERARDTESTIGFQAVVALSKLAGSEDVSNSKRASRPSWTCSSTASPTTPLRKLLIFPATTRVSLNHRSDVRRSALLNLPLTPAILPPMLARTRDTDPPPPSPTPSSFTEDSADALDLRKDA